MALQCLEKILSRRWSYMTHYMQQQHQQFPSVSGSASAIFQPGFAGTNVQEVRALNQGGFASGAAGTYGAPVQAGMGMGSASAMFQPGYAGTNIQEVRQLNAGYASPLQSGGYAQTQAAFPTAGFGAVQSIFSPGFAGTDPQDVRSGYLGGTAGTGFGMHAPQQQQAYAAPLAGGVNAIFQPGFAGTNIQEVRALNYGQAQATAGTGFRTYAPQQQQQTYAAPLGSGASAMFQPGYAGTNVQEVRALNAGQPAPHWGSILPGTH
jgi:hypothetical protein